MEEQSQYKIASEITLHSPSPESEWLRIHQIVARYNIGRSLVYELIQQGILRSVSLKKRGNIRGVRLVSRTSLDQYLNALAAQQKEVR